MPEIHALPTDRQVDVGRVTREKYAPFAAQFGARHRQTGMLPGFVPRLFSVASRPLLYGGLFFARHASRQTSRREEDESLSTRPFHSAQTGRQ